MCRPGVGAPVGGWASRAGPKVQPRVRHRGALCHSSTSRPLLTVSPLLDSTQQHNGYYPGQHRPHYESQYAMEGILMSFRLDSTTCGPQDTLSYCCAPSAFSSRSCSSELCLPSGTKVRICLPGASRGVVETWLGL